MPFKVAVASSDCKFINQHFGRARQFLIFEIKDTGGFQYLALRENAPPCGVQEHDNDLLEKTVDLVSDCKFVFASQIGPGAAGILISRGIQPRAVPGFIEDVLKQFTQNKTKKH